MRRVLALAGFDVGHEKEGKHGAVSSQWCAPLPPYPPYHQQGPRPEFDIILHQVRHPLPTIGSLTTSSPISWRFNARWIPFVPRWHIIKKSAYYWYYWNLMAERQAYATYAIENLKTEWFFLEHTLGFDASYSVIDQVPKDTNSRDHIQVGWEDILKHAGELYVQILIMAKRYGYDIRQTARECYNGQET